MSANAEPGVAIQSNEKTQDLIVLDATQGGEDESMGSSNAGDDVSRKRANEATGSKNANEDVVFQQPDPPRLPTSFWHLPREIRQCILTLACHHDRLHHDHDPGLSTDCSRTINALSLTSRTLYADMMPLLYANVRLTRPSDLRIFAATLNTRPSLGQLVRRIHIGPVDEVDPDWWPLQRDMDPRYDLDQLRIPRIDELFKPDEKPSWLPWTHAFDLEVYEEETSPHLRAVSGAIEDASQILNVNLGKRRRDQGGAHIGEDNWYVLVLEVQAAVELYLVEMGRRDKTKRADETSLDSAAAPAQPPYPRLLIQTDSMAFGGGARAGEDVLWLSRSQILSHLTRRRGLADHFGHPVLFARSGMPWAAMDGKNYQHNGDSSTLMDDEEAVPGFSRADFLDVGDAGIFGTSDGLCDALDPAIPSTATLGGNMALARSLFSFTPFLDSVSLTGFLERVFCGVRPAPAVKSLRSLSLGPPPARWHPPLHLDHPTLASLESLRVCGHELSRDEAAFIAGEWCLFNLSKFQWSQTRLFCEVHDMSLLETINELLVVREEDTVLNVIEDRGAKRMRLDDDHSEPRSTEDSPSPATLSQAASLRIEVRLHPEDVDLLFLLEEEVPAYRQRQWLTGGFQGDSKKRLKIVARGDRIYDTCQAQELEHERKEWWEGRGNWDWSSGVGMAGREEESSVTDEEESQGASPPADELAESGSDWEAEIAQLLHSP